MTIVIVSNVEHVLRSTLEQKRVEWLYLCFERSKERDYWKKGAPMRTRGRKASIGITMSPELIEKLDAIEVGGTRYLPRSTKISMIVERYIREHKEEER